MEPVEEGCVTENIVFSGWYILGCEVGVGWRRIYCLYRSGGIIVRVDFILFFFVFDQI